VIALAPVAYDDNDDNRRAIERTNEDYFNLNVICPGPTSARP